MGDFFAEQGAIAVTQSVHERFHSRLPKTEGAGKPCVRDIFPLCSETAAEYIKHTPAAVLFALIPKLSQRALGHCRGPAHIENSLGRPRFPLRN